MTPPFGIESYERMDDQDLLIEEILICPSSYSIHFFMQAGTCMLILYEEVIGNELKSYIQEAYRLLYVDCCFPMNSPMPGSLATAFFIGYNIRETLIK